MEPTRQPSRGRRCRRLAAWATVAAIATLLLVPASALAHAHLLLSAPADGDVVAEAPTEVQLQFSGSVVAGAGTVQVFAPDQSEVQTGAPAPAKGAKLAQRVTIEDEGTYAVAYRVSSEDGHVITGTFTFSVGAKTEGGGDAASQARDAASVDRSLQVAFS
ncbi:MAG: copper resistance protein CopC, partial [Thermoleophilia bacterium]|nr:copper resistance protein CopC [Thermoleophilia bacterium]